MNDKEFLIKWLDRDGNPYATLSLRALTLSDAHKQAVSKIRKNLSKNAPAYNLGMYGYGYLIEEAT